LIILCSFLFSCNTKSKKVDACVEKIEFHSRKEELMPSLIKVRINDSNDILSKKIEAGELENIILYSIKEEDRFYFLKGEYFEVKNGKILLQITTSFFDSERKIKLSQKEIEEVINGDVGLVFKSSTIRLKACKL
jgi:hypothetical protein